MATIKIIKIEDLSVASQYEADVPSQNLYGGPWADATLFAHVAVPQGLDARKVVPQNIPDTWTKEGEADLLEDPQDDTWTLVPAHIELVEDAALAAQIDAQDADQAVRAILKNAMTLGNQIIEDFATENIMMGITLDGMTGTVLNAMAPVMDALRTGSLHEAIARAKAMPAESKDAKYVTDARLLQAVNRMEEHLGLALSETL